MNPSSNHTQQPSEEELNSNGPNEQWSVGSMSMDGSERAIDSLPNEVLHTIFRFLDEEDWLIAEQALQRMKRYGPSVKSLKLEFPYGIIDWINEIGNTFPNLLSMTLREIQLKNESLKILPVKCSRLTRITLFGCFVTDETIRIILKRFPALKQLKLQSIFDDSFGECFRELGSNIEHLSLTCNLISRDGYLHILSMGTNLQTLKLSGDFYCDALSFSTFCKKTPLRRLCIIDIEWSKEMFLPISRLFFLKELKLEECDAVDSEVLIWISRDCPHLTYVCLSFLPLVCDRGVKCFAKSKRLTRLHCSFMEKVTDESLFALATAGVLETLEILGCAITDRGVAAILAQCPRLRYLNVSFNSGVGDSTVDTAIQTVESRARYLSATRKQSPQYNDDRIFEFCQPVKRSHYLLWLRMSGEVLSRYKDGISHPLLHLDVFKY